MKNPPRLIVPTNADILATLFPSSGCAHGGGTGLVLGMGPFDRQHVWSIVDLEDLVAVSKEMVGAGVLDLHVHRRGKRGVAEGGRRAQLHGRRRRC